MLDGPIRRHIHEPLDRIGVGLEKLGLTPNQMTGIGFVIGVGACVFVATGRWYIGLGMWLLNRIVDGLDGPLARRVGPTELGGFFDIMADFAIYGGIVLAIGFHVPEARVAALVLFLMYYLNGSGFLAWSSIAERLQQHDSERTFHFPTSLAEGTETIVVMSLILLIGSFTEEILWIWSAAVAISVVQRIFYVRRSLMDS